MVDQVTMAVSPLSRTLDHGPTPNNWSDPTDILIDRRMPRRSSKAYRGLRYQGSCYQLRSRLGEKPMRISQPSVKDWQSRGSYTSPRGRKYFTWCRPACRSLSYHAFPTQSHLRYFPPSLVASKNYQLKHFILLRYFTRRDTERLGVKISMSPPIVPSLDLSPILAKQQQAWQASSPSRAAALKKSSSRPPSPGSTLRRINFSYLKGKMIGRGAFGKVFIAM